MEAPDRRQVPARPQPARGSGVIGEGAWDVPALPTAQAKAPGDVVVLLVRKEVLVEILARIADRLECRTTGNHGRTVDGEHLDLVLELAGVLLSLAARHESPLAAEREAGRVDDVGRPFRL